MKKQRMPSPVPLVLHIHQLRWSGVTSKFFLVHDHPPVVSLLHYHHLAIHVPKLMAVPSCLALMRNNHHLLMKLSEMFLCYTRKDAMWSPLKSKSKVELWICCDLCNRWMCGTCECLSLPTTTNTYLCKKCITCHFILKYYYYGSENRKCKQLASYVIKCQFLEPGQIPNKSPLGARPHLGICQLAWP